MAKKKRKSSNGLEEKDPLQTDSCLELYDESTLSSLSGVENEHLKAASKVLNVQIGARGRTLYFKGEKEDVRLAHEVFSKLDRLASTGREFTKMEFAHAIEAVKNSPSTNLQEMYSEIVFRTKSGKQIVAKSVGQKKYVQAIQKNDICFGVGPAGTGKTFLAMANAVSELQKERVSRIVLTRPAVEAGEHLGFLPGNFEEKVLPYLRPLYDALFELLGTERVEALVASGVIEIAPLAFMRGRTLNDAFVILDEAQNTTAEQMKMFLTRLGFGSKMVIAGDATQIDLPSSRPSGLIHAVNILKNVEGVSVCWLTEFDVVRHKLVQSIVRAYDKAEGRNK